MGRCKGVICLSCRSMDPDPDRNAGMKSYSSSFGDVHLSNNIKTLYPLLEQIDRSSTVVIADTNTTLFCYPLIAEGIGPVQLITIPAGEEFKTLETCEDAWSQLIEYHADRDSLIINIGGGVVTDLGGFAASCYQRGIRFVHIPTTVTAMTDAAIGGKLGVDFKDNKNYIGLFNAPEFTWNNPVFLETLPEQEIRAGLAEIVKHAIIGSTSLWQALTPISSLDAIDWMQMLDLSLAVKITIIQEDPFESGLRKTLNFGHTIGHALESYFLEQGNPLSHGHAVAFGMLAESKMAVDLNLLSMPDFENIIDRIHILIQPPQRTIPPAEALASWLQRDKKNSAGLRSFSLPTGIGSCRWDVRDGNAAAAIQWLQEHVSTATFRLLTDSNH
jgi:3-dehydroquinate synthase